MRGAARPCELRAVPTATVAGPPQNRSGFEPRQVFEDSPALSEFGVVFAAFATRVSAAVLRGLGAIATAVQEAVRPFPIATGFVRDSFRTREELVAENAAFRQQLIVASRKVKRPLLRSWGTMRIPGPVER